MTRPQDDTFEHALCRDNLRCIEQLLRLIDGIDDRQFALAAPPDGSSIGTHLRHILDHYDAFLAGLARGVINYDDRGRDAQTERDRALAVRRLHDVHSRLNALCVAALPSALTVHMDCGSDCDSGAPSSVARELQFLVSHTVHHDALIATAARHLGVPLDDGYGIAPSTLRFRQRQTSGG